MQDRPEQQSKVGWLRSAKHKAAGLQSEKTRSMLGSARRLLCSRSFQAVTAAATLNDIGGWALVSWHATFYTRVFDLKPEMYAPLLAAVIPIGGVIGGVGGGLAGDWLSRKGTRWWLTSGGRPACMQVCVGTLSLPYHVSMFCQTQHVLTQQPGGAAGGEGAVRLLTGRLSKGLCRASCWLVRACPGA